MPEVVDGVERYPATGKKVMVAGGGNGGLQAALECWRKGFDVVVLEKQDRISPLGDFFSVSPPGVATLKYYPNMKSEWEKGACEGKLRTVQSDGTKLWEGKWEWARPGAPHAAPDVKMRFAVRRADFTKMQVDQLTRLGVPMHFGQDVTEITEDADGKGVTINTKAGAKYTADVCIAADGKIVCSSKSVGEANFELPGVHSLFYRSRKETLSVGDSGYAISRVAFPQEAIKDGSPASNIVKSGTQFSTWLGNEVHMVCDGEVS